MNREPLGLYIFRFGLAFGLFAFMAMLYWSSELIESDVKQLQESIDSLKRDIQHLKGGFDKIDEMVLRNGPVNPSLSKVEPLTRSQIDPKLPNLLQEDLFYAEILPKMLGPNFRAEGTLYQAQLGKPDNLHPFSNWASVIGWHSQCSVNVSKQQFGKYETMAPDMAIKMEQRIHPESGQPEFWIHLRPGVFWQPLKKSFFSEDLNLSAHFFQKHPVTAYDFKFYLDAIMNPYVQEPQAVALRNYLTDINELEVIDTLTFVVRWKVKEIKTDNGQILFKAKYVAKLLTGSLKPLPSFLYQYLPDGQKIIVDDLAPDTYRTNSAWAQNFSRHWAKNIIASCGPWTFEGMSDQQIQFRRNQDNYFPYDALVESQNTQFKDTQESMWDNFKANKLDLYSLRPDQVLELKNFMDLPSYAQQEKQGDAIKRLDYVSRVYSYIGWNEAKIYFKSKKVRQALTMAIDRQRIIEKNLNGMGIMISGPFYRYSPAYDVNIAPWPFDEMKARNLLEEEGWYDKNGTGVIGKEIDGNWVPFEFSLVYYVKNATAKAICEYVSTALKKIGIICNLNGVDVADLSTFFDNKSFDAICMAWGLGTPPEDPKQLWYSAGSNEKGSSNSIDFSNAEADSIIEALEYEDDPQKRLTLYHRFHAIIHEECPYTFLFTPKTSLLYRERVQNVFIPAERQDILPGANVGEPDSNIFWLKATNQEN